MTKYSTAKDPTAFLGLTLIMFYLFRFGKIVYRGSGVAIGGSSTEIQAALFFSVIGDSTKDISKV